jgi:hypothetical protein
LQPSSPVSSVSGGNGRWWCGGGKWLNSECLLNSTA